MIRLNESHYLIHVKPIYQRNVKTISIVKFIFLLLTLIWKRAHASITMHILARVETLKFGVGLSFQRVLKLSRFWLFFSQVMVSLSNFISFSKHKNFKQQGNKQVWCIHFFKTRCLSLQPKDGNLGPTDYSFLQRDRLLSKTCLASTSLRFSAHQRSSSPLSMATLIFNFASVN